MSARIIMTVIASAFILVFPLRFFFDSLLNNNLAKLHALQQLGLFALQDSRRAVVILELDFFHIVHQNRESRSPPRLSGYSDQLTPDK